MIEYQRPLNPQSVRTEPVSCGAVEAPPIDREIMFLAAEFPHLAWESASLTPWSECVRDAAKQPQPETLSQRNLHSNNHDCRREFLKLCGNILRGRVNSADELKGYIAEMHRKLILGDSGESVYMNPDHVVKVRGKSAHDVAGKFSMYQDDKPIKDLLVHLKSFLSACNCESKSIQALVQQAGEIYLRDLNGFLHFSYGMNSIYMNMVNGLIRLAGLNGVQHATLDIEFLCGSNADKFPAVFAQHVSRHNPGFA